ncbi:MAG: efflux RND transporter periplasmic adaptor subunit [Alphaproteobacteria bacterium]|nr:efflux RND transporter periplasmic adaptor subunit [Alphaproteobacteria bacterium]
MLKKRFILIVSAAGALALAGGGAFLAGAMKSANASSAAASAPEQQGPPPAPVEIAKAVETELAPLSEAPGSIVSVRDSLIAATTSGKIEWVADVGAEVNEGDVIARIDPADAKYSRDQAAADVRRLEARADYLENLYKRYVSLGAESGESEASLDSMKTDSEEAKANLDRARASLKQAEINLRRTEVRAPFSGRIVSQSTQIGEFATPGAPIARLVDTRHLEVTAQAQAALLKSVKPGDHITLANGVEKLEAPIRAIVPVGNQVSRTLEIRISLPETSWKIGAAVRVFIPETTPKPVVAGRRDALILRANKVSVFVVGDDMKARRVDVELGAAQGDLIELIGDVKPGDALVVRGGERLRDGQAVKISSGAADNATT